MKNNFGRQIIPTRKPTKFNPDHDFIRKVIKDYVRKGGKITKIEYIPMLPDFFDGNAFYNF